MGCINSTKKMHTSKRGNVFQVSLVGLTPDLPLMPRCGVLELKPLELVFTASGNDPIKWALQHLRRYGLNGNIFSFETGRRCVMGSRIYMFRCCNADLLYQKFQRYVNSITAERNRNHNSDTFEAIARMEYNTKANHYLQSSSNNNVQSMNHHTIPQITLQTEDNSTHDVNNATRVILKREHKPETPLYTNVNPGNGNMNGEELSQGSENNNNVSCDQSKGVANDLNSTCSVQSSDTVISPTINIHFYGNINEFTPVFIQGSKDETPFEHFYENLSMNINTQQYPSNAEFRLTQSTPHPTINYIVLDLHKPEASGTTMKSTTSLPINVENTSHREPCQAQVLPVSTNNLLNTTNHDAQHSCNATETCRGYSTIDFVKTCALNRSPGNCTEFDVERDSGECRLTRHSKSLYKYHLGSE